MFVVCQLFEYCTTFPSWKASYQHTCAVDLVQNIEHQKENRHMKKNLPCVTQFSNIGLALIELTPGISSSTASSYRSKVSPALSSFIVATVTIILAEPVTCAVYCSVDIAQRKHHLHVQAPVIYHPPTPHANHQHHQITNIHTHIPTQKITHCTFFSRTQLLTHTRKKMRALH